MHNKINTEVHKQRFQQAPLVTKVETTVQCWGKQGMRFPVYEKKLQKPESCLLPVLRTSKSLNAKVSQAGRWSRSLSNFG